MSIYTDSGVTLFQDTPRTVSFTATPTLVDGASGAPVTVDGVPVTGATSPMPIQSGALAGYAALRDTLAPQYGAQLDQIAGGLINAFAESDQSASPTLPSLPGLFTTSGATSLPSTSAATGLAASIEVNPTVDPSQGGNVDLLRDGGIFAPGNPAYTYNATGAASYTGRIDATRRRDRRDAEFRSARPGSARRPASPTTPTLLSAGCKARTSRRAAPRPIRTRWRPRRLRRCRTRPASISTRR